MRVLFLCTGNSCRSQMAEGLCRHIHGADIACKSAGIERHGLNPLAVKAMAEIGIDISGHTSKTINDLDDTELGNTGLDKTAFDYIITVCEHANEACPVLPAATEVIHQAFDDPPTLATDSASEAEALVHYRRVRDEIKVFIERLPQTLSRV